MALELEEAAKKAQVEEARAQAEAQFALITALNQEKEASEKRSEEQMSALRAKL